jgi:hypothetical protein
MRQSSKHDAGTDGFDVCYTRVFGTACQQFKSNAFVRNVSFLQLSCILKRDQQYEVYGWRPTNATQVYKQQDPSYCLRGGTMQETLQHYQKC